MKITGIIPARYASLRFPGKPLAMIVGKPMLQRVYEQAKKTTSLNDVVVATDDKRILDKIVSFGGKAYLSQKEHENGTSRCAEYVEHTLVSSNDNYIINIQGDEPLIHPNQIDEFARLFIDKKVTIATQVKKEHDLSLLNNRNIVKASLDTFNYAIDFKRIIIDEQELKEIEQQGFFYKHIGIYGFQANTLLELVALPPSENELERHLEQMRWLDNGYKIKAGITNYESISVDTLEDLKIVEDKIKNSNTYR